MVIAGKVFIVREEVDLNTIASKLKGYRYEEVYEHEGKEIPLVTEIRDLTASASSVEGVYTQDIPVTVYHREGAKLVTKTIEAPFSFDLYDDKLFLLIVEKKRLANNIANQLSKILFISVGSIVEAKIPPETLKRFHEQNPEDTKVIFFDNVDIPNVNKLSLYGSALADTALYNEYCSHGMIWYIVYKSRKYGVIAGLTRNAVVTVFGEMSLPDFISYVRTEVYPLIA
ncbi:MAG: hypothetical protein DRJ31_05370 [Candidatus Methanomethylicota archaeon]|uniref:Uncharacterized protein n=1 Tax=Thermoproteota archaeon TaxID=2056631 RepID=A0A497EPJ6_9CREN|nr:MAG: hypothetical protein DRJ31_05370 [Candidatus Verstraetearchaeota archaeon]